MNNGIQPTVELATNNGNAYPYPVYPMMGGYGNGGFGGDGSWIWLILILALFGWGNNGNNGGFFGGNSFDNGYAWLSNGQKDIMNNTNNGFDTLHLSNQLEGNRDAINGLATSLCSNTANVISAINNGFSSAEISANARQIADMNQNFNNQIATLNGFNSLNTSLLNCCCENRLGIANLGADIAREACADRQAVATGVRDILDNQTRVGQSILDKLCQLELDNVKAQVEAKNDKIIDLQRELQMADLKASQIAQTAEIRTNNATVANQLVSELRSCPIPAQPVYGNSPIFTCNGNNGYGCGCNGFNNII